MKKFSLAAFCAAGMATGLFGQTAIQPSTPTLANASVPAPTAYHVVEHGANHRIWQRETSEPGPKGKTITKVHKYTELATGMYYQDEKGQWQESQELVEPFSGGAIARHGQHQVIFANNLNSEGAIDQKTPDGKRLRSNILGLEYYDSSSGKSVVIAQIQDSQGQLVGRNQVLYPNAFNGVKADVEYTYKRGSFEQDVILREQLPDASAYGLNPATTTVEVMTEFLNPPSPALTDKTSKHGGPSDQDISWGTMQIGHGKAFGLGQPSQKKEVSVTKSYQTINGRTVLFESAPLKQVLPGLQNLPLHASIKTRQKVIASKKLALPGTPLAAVSHQPIQLARIAPASQGYVLDYLELNTDQTDFTFQGDTTYYISAPVNFSGTTTIEGGTVIKFDPSADESINILDSVNCQTGSYRPAIFTTVNDETVGESVPSGSGAPCSRTFYLYVQNDWSLPVGGKIEDGNDVINNLQVGSGGNANYSFPAELGQTYNLATLDPNFDAFGISFSPTLDLGSIEIDSSGNVSYSETGEPLCTAAAALTLPNGGTLHDLRFTGLSTAVYSGSYLGITNAQFINCSVGIQGFYNNFYAGNILMAGVGTGFYGQDISGQVEQMTFDANGGGGLVTDDSDGISSLSSLNIVNSIITSPNGPSGWSYGVVPVTTDHVGDSDYDFILFVQAGAGSYYMVGGSDFEHTGSPNISSSLLAQLANKTTYPPIIYSGGSFSTPKNFTPQAQRDNYSYNGGTPDYGYHYDPLDYIFGGYNAGGNITFSAGMAVGWYDNGYNYGLGLFNGMSATFNGTVTSPCFFSRYSMVQESYNVAWPGIGWWGGIVNADGTYVASNPAIVTAHFTHFTKPAADSNHMRDGANGQPIAITGTDCEFLNGFGGYNNEMAFTNCLFDRADYLGNSTSETYPHEIYVNCTFHGGGLSFGHWESGAPYWYSSIQNCSFDNTTFSIDHPFGANTAYENYNYNAFLVNAPQPPNEGANKITVNSFNWQSSWLGNYYLPSGSPLVDAGSTTADRVGLYEYTTQTSQTEEGITPVDIGYHYVALDANGNPLDTFVAGIPDYLSDPNGSGLPLSWQMSWFGNDNQFASEMGSGYTMLFDYQHHLDPNIIGFNYNLPSSPVNANSVSGTINVVQGVPSYMAILVNDNNQADAVWQPYNPNFTINLNQGNRVYNVQIGLRGLPANATQTWLPKTLSLDATPLALTITSPSTDGTVSQPFIQVQGSATRPLASVTYDVENNNGSFPNQTGYITSQYVDPSIQASTTCYFQCYDVALASGLNTITVHATDINGNTTTTSSTVTLDYSSDHTPPNLTVVWPQSGTSIAANQFTLQGTIDDITASVTGQIVNGGNTTTIQGTIERNGTVWINNLPISAGENTLTLTATDAAGNSTSSTLTLYQSSVLTTVTPFTANQLNASSATVSGTISDASQALTVNGLAASITPDASDAGGTWQANNVPVSPSGTAVIDVEIGGVSGSLQSSQSQAAAVFMDSYSANDHCSYFDSYYQQPYSEDTAVDWDLAWGGFWSQSGVTPSGEGGQPSNPIGPWFNSLPPAGPDFTPPSFGFPVIWESADINTTYMDSDGDPVSWSHSVNTGVKLVPYGQQSVGGTVSYLVCACASEYTDYNYIGSGQAGSQPIPPNSLQIHKQTLVSSGVVNTDGSTWGCTLIQVPAGAPVDVTPSGDNNCSFNVKIVRTKEDWQRAVQLQTDVNGGVQIENFVPANGFGPNRANMKAIYAFYQYLFQQPGVSTWGYWPGLAKLAGADIYAGLSDAQNAPTFVPDFQVTTMTMATNIYSDIAWQFEAYMQGGLDALEYIYAGEPGALDLNAITAWQEIDQGVRLMQQNNPSGALSILDGNKRLLQREQQQILPPGYAQLSALSTVLFSDFAQCPMWDPATSKPYFGRDFMTVMNNTYGSGSYNLANTADRWNWVTAPGVGIWDTWSNMLLSDRVSQVNVLLITRAITYAQFPATLY